MSRARRPHRLILCNDGGTLQGLTREAPLGAQGLADAVVGPLRDTQVDTLYWQLGTDPGLATPSHRLTDIYSHNTTVGPRFGAKSDRFDTAGKWRMYENTRALQAEDTDPPAVVVDAGHHANLDVFLSLRVNDIHDGSLSGSDHPLFSPVKRAHPEWLLGPATDLDEGPIVMGESRIKNISRFAYDFGVPEVREYKLALATEAIDKYDIDGLDLDFCRFPRLFAQTGTDEGREVLTAFMRQIRSALDKKSERIDKPLLLSVRVPPTFALARPFGIDVEAWLDKGLLDIVIVGCVHSSMHRAPLEEYVDACRGTGVQVIAQNLGMLWYDRPRSARVIWHEPIVYTDEMCRAAAATNWRAGVDGLYLFNNHLIGAWSDDRYQGNPWNEIADPALIARRDKHYLADNPHEYAEWARELGGSPVPAGPLPVQLSDPGHAAQINVDIADDLDAAAAEGALEAAKLRVLVVNLSERDEVAYYLNGTLLDTVSAMKQILYNDFWYEFDVPPPLLRQGWNVLGIEVIGRNPHIDAPLTVESVEVVVRYT